MANGHGGYRAPANPAAVSGPGKMSRRTDGKQPVMPMGNGDYGDATQLQQLQQSAPLAQVSQGGAGAPAPQPTGDPTAALTPLGAPTTMPDTPVTDGAALGAGQGTAAIGVPQNPRDMTVQDANALRPYLQAMISAAGRQDATPAFRRYVRQVISSLS